MPSLSQLSPLLQVEWEFWHVCMYVRNAHTHTSQNLCQTYSPPSGGSLVWWRWFANTSRWTWWRWDGTTPDKRLKTTTNSWSALSSSPLNIISIYCQVNQNVSEKDSHIPDIRSKPGFYLTLCLSSGFNVWSFRIICTLDFGVCSAVYREWATKCQLSQLLLQYYISRATSHEIVPIDGCSHESIGCLVFSPRKVRNLHSKLSSQSALSWWDHLTGMTASDGTGRI